MMIETPRTIAVRQSKGAPTLSCLLYGADPRFLFVHGANASVATWAPVMGAMAELGQSCIALDLRGHGKSFGKDSLQKNRIQDYVEDVSSVLKEFLTIKTLVGHSMGGLVCQLVASRATVDHLVLVASSPVRGMLKDGVRMVLRHPITFMAASLRRSFARLYRVPAVAKSLLFHPDTPDDKVETFLSNLQEESWLGGNQMLWVWPRPSAVTCSVKVIGGIGDSMVSPSSVAATARAYGVAPVFFEDAAHMVPLEAQPKALAECLIENDNNNA